MKKLYVVGNKASKSLSPTIFNYWFKKYKIDAQYNYLQLNKKNFDKKITNTLKDKDVKGLNITIPFKKNIIKHTETLDVHSKRINAVSCMTNLPFWKTDAKALGRTVQKMQSCAGSNTELASNR